MYSSGGKATTVERAGDDVGDFQVHGPSGEHGPSKEGSDDCCWYVVLVGCDGLFLCRGGIAERLLTVFGLNLDGVAPRAKMNQQRARRFRSAQEAREADEKKEEFQKMLAKQNAKKGEQELQEEVVQKTWDSNVITPGTPFMDILAAALRYWIAYKLNTDPAWEKVCLLLLPYCKYRSDFISSKSSFRMPRCREKENTKSWNLSDPNAHLLNMIRTLVTLFMVWYVFKSSLLASMCTDLVLP